MSAIVLNIPPAEGKQYPPGPSSLQRALSGQLFRRTPMEDMRQTAAQYGDLVHFRIFSRHIYQLNHPALVEDLLLKDAGKHVRGVVMQRAKTILGEGLLTSEDPFHMRQRRLAQPAFLRQRIASYGSIIGQNSSSISSTWVSGSVVDVYTEMLELALRIVGKCLFDIDVQSREQVMKISAAVDAFMGFLPIALMPFSEQLQRFPLPAMRRIRKAQVELDAMIYGMITERRRAPGDRGDLLSMLLDGRDAEDPAASMSDRQVHDECLTILLAGHETTANALSFSLWLMGQHPEVQERLAREAAAVLGGRTAGAEEYARLPYTTAVFSESMRLFPPVWAIARTCVQDYEIAGYPIKAGAAVIAPQAVLHRDERFFPEPDKFDPERWMPQNREAAKLRPRFAFYPFGGGSRQCIGEGLAWMEGVLSLATLVRDWRFTPEQGAPRTIALNPAISLRPRHGVSLRVDRRG